LIQVWTEFCQDCQKVIFITEEYFFDRCDDCLSPIEKTVHREKGHLTKGDNEKTTEYICSKCNTHFLQEEDLEE